jgi:hypothetical protein
MLLRWPHPSMQQAQGCVQHDKIVFVNADDESFELKQLAHHGLAALTLFTVSTIALKAQWGRGVLTNQNDIGTLRSLPR